MGRKIYSPEQIIRKLREAEVLIIQGNTISRASRQLGITEQTYFRWRKQYCGMQVSQAKLISNKLNLICTNLYLELPGGYQKIMLYRFTFSQNICDQTKSPEMIPCHWQY